MAFHYILAFVFVAIGLALCGGAYYNYLRGAASKRWPQVPGRIVRSFVLVDDSGDGASYTPQVEYEYIVDGTVRTGKRFRYGQTGASGRAGAEKLLAAYPVDATVPVFVNPDDPADAVLINGTSAGNWWMVFAGVVLLGSGYLALMHMK